MRTFILEVKMENDAFIENDVFEMERIFQGLRDRMIKQYALPTEEHRWPIFDTNGNIVGEAFIREGRELVRVYHDNMLQAANLPIEGRPYMIGYSVVRQ